MFYTTIAYLFIVISLNVIGIKSTNHFIKAAGDDCTYAKSTLPAGFLLVNILKKSFNSPYDRKIANQLASYFNDSNTLFHLRTHWAQKASNILLLTGFIFIISCFSEADLFLIIAELIFLIAIFFLNDSRLSIKIKRRQNEISADFPHFVEKFTLLVNTGLPLQKSWERAALSGEKTGEKIIKKPVKKSGYLSTELARSLALINAGTSFGETLEKFIRRCRCAEVTRFISIIILNSKKGGPELSAVLRVMTSECWQNRKNTARRLGEEASTKLLFPMMLIFASILLIVATPAILSLRNI